MRVTLLRTEQWCANLHGNMLGWCQAWTCWMPSFWFLLLGSFLSNHSSGVQCACRGPAPSVAECLGRSKVRSDHRKKHCQLVRTRVACGRASSCCPSPLFAPACGLSCPPFFQHSGPGPPLHLPARGAQSPFPSPGHVCGEPLSSPRVAPCPKAPSPRPEATTFSFMSKRWACLLSVLSTCSVPGPRLQPECFSSIPFSA